MGFIDWGYSLVQPQGNTEMRPSLTSLPDDVLVEIASRLKEDVSARGALMCTCKRMQKIVQGSPTVWNSVRLRIRLRLYSYFGIPSLIFDMADLEYAHYELVTPENFAFARGLLDPRTWRWAFKTVLASSRTVRLARAAAILGNVETLALVRSWFPSRVELWTEMTRYSPEFGFGLLQCAMQSSNGGAVTYLLDAAGWGLADYLGPSLERDAEAQSLLFATAAANPCSAGGAMLRALMQPPLGLTPTPADTRACLRVAAVRGTTDVVCQVLMPMSPFPGVDPAMLEAALARDDVSTETCLAMIVHLRDTLQGVPGGCAVVSYLESRVENAACEGIAKGNARLLRALRAFEFERDRLDCPDLDKRRCALYTLLAGWGPSRGHERLETLVELRTAWGMGAHDVQAGELATAGTFLVTGPTDILQELHLHWGLTRDVLLQADDPGCPRMTMARILLIVVQHGDARTVPGLRDWWGCTADDARANSNLAVRSAARQGRVDVLEALRVTFGLSADDARANSNEALRFAAANGHVNVLSSLRACWGLGSADARANGNEALHRIAATQPGDPQHMREEEDRVRVLRSLREEWGLGADDARSNNNELFFSAVFEGRIGVMVELLRGWGLDAGDARKHSLYSVAAQIGDVEAMHLLRYGFGVTREDAAAHNYDALCMAGSAEVLSELRRAWGWGAAEARAQDCAALFRALQLGDAAMVRELRLGYGLVLSDLERCKVGDIPTAAAQADMAAEIACWA